MNDRTGEQMMDSGEQRVSAEAIVAKYDADIYILARGELFQAIDDTEATLLEAEDLGSVINDAQATLSDGRVLVAADGLLGAAIEQANQVSISGPNEGVELTPAEAVGGSYAIYRTPPGTSGGRLESFNIDMQYRGGSAVVADGETGLNLADVHIKNAGTHAIALSGGASADIRDARFESTSKDAVNITGCTDVQIDGCEVSDSNHAVSVASSSNVTIRDSTTRGAEYSAIALQEYTTNWKVTGCKAINSGSTPFAASTVQNGTFVDCVAEGTTNDRQGGFEIEYNADHDDDNREDPVVGCSVVSCTARDCNMGFYAREDDSKYETGIPVFRPQFVDCKAVDCDTGLFLGDNVVEAVVRNFDAVDCGTDIVDDGIRTIADGRSANGGDPATEGQWFGHADTALELDVVVEDTQTGTQYEARAKDGWKKR